MELKIKEYQLPSDISFNFDELKSELTEKVKLYETMVYGDDQIKEAKADRAQLNKLKNVLNSERIRMEREYMQPFNRFKSQIGEIIDIIDKPIGIIDEQIKSYDDQKKAEKLEEIKALFASIDVPDGLTFEKLFEPRMLNVSYNMAHVKQAFSDRIKRFNRDMETLSELPEFGFEAQQVYISTLDINHALNEGKRMAEIARKKAEAAAEEERRESQENDRKEPKESVEKVTEKKVAQNKEWVSFQALLSREDALELKSFFDKRGIAFKAI